MIAELALAACAFVASDAVVQDGGRSALARGEMRLALEEARARGDALSAARGEVEVRYHAGDLLGALEVARAALREHPHDIELAWRECDLATNLGRTRLAEAALERFRAAPLPPDADRSFWDRQRAFLEGEIATLTARERAIDAASTRARVVALGALALSIALMLALTRAPRSRS